MARPKKVEPGSKRSASIYRLKKFGSRKKEQAKKGYQKTVVYSQRKPFTSFFIALGILALVILVGSTIFRVTAPKVETRSEPKNVNVYSLGQNAKITVQGEVKKGGVIKIVAQAPGIVSAINAKEGDEAAKGKVIISLSSNYQGGNAASLQRQLAGLTYQNTKETYDTQKEIIAKQKELIAKQSENSEELRDITQVSINDTRDLLNLNNDILSQMKTNLQNLQNSNADPAQILAQQQLISQVQAGTNQLSSALRSTEYANNTENAPVEMENINRDIALKQITVQEKGLENALKAAGISLKLAQVQEANMFPAAPFYGTIQKIHVKVGDSINPGVTLVTFSGNTGEVIVDAKVTKEISEKVSKITPSVIFINGQTIETLPSYVSTDATSGQLYSVLFRIDESKRDLFTEGGYISVTLPISEGAESITPFVPIDSVFQTQDEAYVYVVEGNVARSRQVKLGTVTGGFVTVLEGLSQNDRVILNRNVVDGDKINVTGN